MKNISTLTKEQDAQIPKYIQKWIDLASEPIDRKKIKSIFKKIYGKDKLIVIGESFQNTIDLIRIATEGKKLERDSQLRSQLDSQLRSQLRSQLHSQLRSQFYSQLRSQLDSHLYSQLDSQLRSQLRSQLHSQLRSQFYSQLRSQLDSHLYSQLDSQLRSQLDSHLYSQLHSQLRSQNIKYSSYISYYLYDWAGYYDYADSIGVEFNKDSLEQYFDILLNIPIVIFIDDVLFVCEKPKVSWNNSLLHNDKLPAIRWSDGTGFYYLNGVNFPKELWERVVSGTMPFNEILAIVDIDQRTQAMRYGSVSDFVKYAKAELLDSHTKTRLDGSEITYQLYKFPKGDIFTEDAYYMVYDDLVPGSSKQYMSGVIASKTVPEAMAWKFSTEDYTLTSEMWLELKPGLTMN